MAIKSVEIAAPTVIEKAALKNLTAEECLEILAALATVLNLD